MLDSLKEAIEEVQKTLQIHHGGIELVSWDSDTGELILAFTGTCASCALSQITLKKGVEVILCERVPAIKKIRLASSCA